MNALANGGDEQVGAVVAIDVGKRGAANGEILELETDLGRDVLEVPLAEVAIEGGAAFEGGKEDIGTSVIVDVGGGDSRAVVEGAVGSGGGFVEGIGEGDAGKRARDGGETGLGRGWGGGGERLPTALGKWMPCLGGLEWPEERRAGEQDEQGQDPWHSRDGRLTNPMAT